jgi:hypothetical protein
MTNKSKLAIIAAVLATTIATPAFAQSFSSEFGTGNALPFEYQSAAPRSDRLDVRQNHVAVHRSGLQAYAMVPRSRATYDNSSNATGGASAGYEQMLHTY